MIIVSSVHFARKYLRDELLPTAFCPGCGNGIVMNALLKALNELGYDSLDGFAFVSGIGCGAWTISPYFKADTLHTLHGRAIAYATGLKIANPNLNVVVMSGDGDLSAIGGNHLIHAARRNMDLIVIMINNFIYGMTGGQVSPTTFEELTTTTTPYGNPDPPIDASEVVAAAGANYVARWTTAHVYPLIRSIKEALNMDGFRFIEVISQCPTSFGRRIGKPDPDELIKWFKTISEMTKKGSLELNDGSKIRIGQIAKRNRPGYISKLKAIQNKAKGV